MRPLRPVHRVGGHLHPAQRANASGAGRRREIFRQRITRSAPLRALIAGFGKTMRRRAPVATSIACRPTSGGWYRRAQPCRRGWSDMPGVEFGDGAHFTRRPIHGAQLAWPDRENQFAGAAEKRLVHYNSSLRAGTGTRDRSHHGARDACAARDRPRTQSTRARADEIVDESRCAETDQLPTSAVRASGDQALLRPCLMAAVIQSPFAPKEHSPSCAPGKSITQRSSRLRAQSARCRRRAQRNALAVGWIAGEKDDYWAIGQLDDSPSGYREIS